MDSKNDNIINVLNNTKNSNIKVTIQKFELQQSEKDIKEFDKIVLNHPSKNIENLILKNLKYKSDFFNNNLNFQEDII